ncbi:MAG: hypothetical protein JWN08_3159 [Frankiales bacterium]|nr:hypothetical protein [Frankiales bacterium]
MDHDARTRTDASRERAAQLHKKAVRLRLSSALIALRSEELLLQSQVERYLRGSFVEPVSPS